MNTLWIKTNKITTNYGSFFYALTPYDKKKWNYIELLLVLHYVDFCCGYIQ